MAATESPEERLARLTSKFEATAKKSGALVQLAPLKKQATDEDMTKHWTGDRFFVAAKVPQRKEQPKHVRDLQMKPLSKETPVDVLKRHGTSVVNVKGVKSDTDTTVGQDMFSNTYLGNGWWLDLVADGHGPIGDVVAERIAKVLPHYMDSQECSEMLKHDKIDEAFEAAFERSQKDVEDTLGGKEKSNKLQRSGTTCVCMLRKHGSKKLHMAWVGDSKAIVINRDGKVLFQTSDHQPKNLTERQRIERMGCEVVEDKHEDGLVLQKVMIKGQDFPNIAFTRSFGDQCVKNFGVNAIPQVEHWDCAQSEMQDGFVLIASDGVWEFIEVDAVGKFIGDAIKKDQPPEAFLPELVKKSQKAWQDHEDGYCDDITAVLCTVKTPEHQPPAEPERHGICVITRGEACGICSVM